MKIRWSKHAFESLNDVLEYSLESFGYIQQLAIEEIIVSTIEKLASFPYMCPIIPEISDSSKQYRKLVVTREISVIYWCDEEHVNISFIWDTRRSLHQIFYILGSE